MSDQNKSKKSGRKRGRSAIYVMPDPIPDTPKNVARAILNTPPKKDDDWDFLKPGSGARRDR